MTGDLRTEKPGFAPGRHDHFILRQAKDTLVFKDGRMFGRILVEPRQLLLIDEPTKGLAPAIVVAMIECFAEIKRRGATIVLVEQNFRVAQEIGDSVLVMDNGSIVHRGAMAALAQDTALQERLLGLSLEAHQ